MLFLDDWNRIRRSLREKIDKPRKRRRLPVPLTVNYHERWLVPLLAVFVGTFMVVYGHHRPFGYFVRSLDFYKAAIPSIASAWAVMHLVVRSTRLLDSRLPWRLSAWPSPVRRVLLQVYHGVVRPGFFILGVFSLYFLLRGRLDLIPRYFVEDFPLVLVLLTGFNLLCWVYYRLRMDELLGQWTDWTRMMRKNAPQELAAEVLPGVEVISYGERMKDSVALFEPDARHEATRSTAFDGREDLDARPAKEVYVDVAGPHFFQVRRELIVNRRAIQEVRREGEKVEVLLDAPRAGTIVRVSKRRCKAFLTWWHAADG